MFMFFAFRMEGWVTLWLQPSYALNSLRIPSRLGERHVTCFKTTHFARKNFLCGKGVGYDRDFYNSY